MFVYAPKYIEFVKISHRYLELILTDPLFQQKATTAGKKTKCFMFKRLCHWIDLRDNGLMLSKQTSDL